jgi:hypothetical protein
MRISFDLDDTLICYHDGARHEPNPARWWRRWFASEPLRLGAASLLAELAARHELWVYTTSFRHPREVAWWLWAYGLRVQYVVNQDRHERTFGRSSGRSKNPAGFGIALHFDDSWGVWWENRFERNVCVVQPSDPDWVAKVRDAVSRIERNELLAEPPDLPEEYRSL